MQLATCPYCASTLTTTDNTFYCAFCQMKISKHIVQTNGKRLVIRTRDFIQPVQLEQSTRLLKKLSTYELLELYHFIRAEEQAAEALITFADEFDMEKPISDDSVLEKESLSWKKKKRFVLENLLRERFGYIPNITTRYLEEYREKIRQDDRISSMKEEE